MNTFPRFSTQLRHSLSKRSVQGGVGMIEVLVTLFILSIGLLGVASLQFVASFSNADALNRSQSVMLAQQFSERLRVSAAPSAVTDGFVVDNAYFDDDLYNFNNLSCGSAAQAYACFCQAHPADIPNCQSGQCSSAQFAAFDAYQMSCAAVKTNPNMQVNLLCDDQDAGDADLCTAGSIHSVIVAWPVKSWQNNARELNAQCNVDRSEAHDCVIVEVAL